MFIYSCWLALSYNNESMGGISDLIINENIDIFKCSYLPMVFIILNIWSCSYLYLKNILVHLN